MNKQQIILVSIIGLIFVGIWWLAYNDMGEVEPIENVTLEETTSEEETTSDEEPMVTSDTSASTQQSSSNMDDVEVVTPATSTEADEREDEEIEERENPEEIESGSYVDQVFADENSKRCTWKDRDTGLEGFALIKDGKVLVESERDDEDKDRITLYTSAASYVWIEDADEGTVITNDLQPDEEVVTYQTKSEIAEYIETSEWVECKEQVLSDSHFEVPRDIEFSEPAEF